ncbi:hypothetical protein [Eubacterium aggregans]|uniref:hypothetical protein n=1 Tax=Eubacterium aggregans TaxID=81409 RepID=UPI003F668B2A
MAPSTSLKTPPYVWAAIIEFLVFSAQFVFPFLYSFVISGIYGEALDRVSSVLLPGYCIVAIICLFAVTKIVKHLKNSGTLLIGASTIALGLILTALLLPYGILRIVVTAVIVMAGYAIIYSPMVDTIVGTLDADHLGCGIGLNDMIINVSCSLGITVVSIIMSRIPIENFENRMDAIFNYQMIFAGISIVIILSIVLLFLKRRDIYKAS